MPPLFSSGLPLSPSSPVSSDFPRLLPVYSSAGADTIEPEKGEIKLKSSIEHSNVLKLPAIMRVLHLALPRFEHGVGRGSQTVRRGGGQNRKEENLLPSHAAQHAAGVRAPVGAIRAIWKSIPGSSEPKRPAQKWRIGFGLLAGRRQEDNDNNQR